MARNIEFQGKIHTFPDDFTDEEISLALNSLSGKETQSTSLTKVSNLQEGSSSDYYLVAGSVFILILVGYFILRNLSKDNFKIMYSLIKRLFALFIILFVLWMFRYEVTPTHPHQCLDRWIGEVVSC